VLAAAVTRAAAPPVLPPAARAPAPSASPTPPAGALDPSAPARPAPTPRGRGDRLAAAATIEPATITVSIGRVELRAAAPAAAPPGSAAATPQFSLEAYLEGRARE
jgi:hypothetical protein